MSQDEQDSSWYRQTVRSLATPPAAWTGGRDAPVGTAPAALRIPGTSPIINTWISSAPLQ